MSDPSEPTDNASCLCGSGEQLVACCGRFLDQGTPAETAEQLMRSRFSAYSLKRVDYLIETTHPDSRTPGTRRVIETNIERVTWTSLKILSARQGLARDKIGKVEFAAEYQTQGESHSHHEHSRFRRFEGKWKYFDDQG